MSEIAVVKNVSFTEAETLLTSSLTGAQLRLLPN
jgi:hypothetical protein